MFTIGDSKGLAGIWGRKRIEHINVEESSFIRTPQKPSAVMSRWAPSSEMAEAWLSVSPEIGCKVGSIVVLLQTSLIHPAMVSLTSLCLAFGRPPFGHERTCSTDMLTPQAQWVGKLAGVHLYLRASAFLKVPLCKVKPYSCRGRVSNQLEEPFSYRIQLNLKCQHMHILSLFST